MKQAAVVYWSGTGNTEAMAKKLRRESSQPAQKPMSLALPIFLP